MYNLKRIRTKSTKNLNFTNYQTTLSGERRTKPTKDCVRLYES